jgi:hypothetical protein
MALYFRYCALMLLKLVIRITRSCNTFSRRNVTFSQLFDDLLVAVLFIFSDVNSSYYLF